MKSADELKAEFMDVSALLHEHQRARAGLAADDVSAHGRWRVQFDALQGQARELAQLWIMTVYAFETGHATPEARMLGYVARSVMGKPGGPQATRLRDVNFALAVGWRVWREGTKLNKAIREVVAENAPYVTEDMVRNAWYANKAHVESIPGMQANPDDD
ncbi:hypothetical protein LJ655_03455 [Paraburkholderia sp. MMS20-SJTN17]|uniref:Uncharacterized protein n=1 Tax=Paraburkholderia translucens TaxID=2886945 RepID=A0ABS8K885_9BURK|nr:hypothetical protein [Paraburkholderia sp. MMS20-SJTN17]MCC8400957.1 hypothetical protein [Paraburkholderia sp. MMS20-SJTN17]